MTVYEITFKKEKYLDFDKLKQEFNFSRKTNVLNETNPINIGEKEFSYSHKKTPEKTYLELKTIDKRFIDFLREADFDFEVTESEV